MTTTLLEMAGKSVRPSTGGAPSTSSGQTIRSVYDVSEDAITNCKLLDKYRNADGTLNYDFFYENPGESSLQLEGSVVRHLLTQIRIGMDLSKISLPTFILERRSLLEMYADHFCHPQLFTAIADGASPHDRMLGALRWYTSSFHAGHNIDLAKKPYNPILGETFSCCFDFEKSEEDDELVKNGPVPWAKESQLAFFAEQVSHHPPITAFYAEHARKKIMCCAHVWTKSRFYGLSIGVLNAGKAVVTVLDHNEQYIFTFPSAYAKSILSVPYVELGGPVTADCPQTGYRAEIEFLTKSFYSSKRNRLSCRVYSPHHSNPTDFIEGEWTGALTYTKTSSTSCNQTNSSESVFVDVTKTPIYKKNVLPLALQSPKESRYLWRQVTAALFVNDVELASQCKFYIEQIQRNDTNQRKESNLEYVHEHFQRETMEDDTAWSYKHSLDERLQTPETRPKKHVV